MTLSTSDTPLTPAERLVLREAAHSLKPTVMIGQGGITPAIITEIKRSLDAHQLIKLKILSDDRELRQQLHQDLYEQLDCHPIQVIGKIVVLFKDNGSYIPPHLLSEKNHSKQSTKKGPHIPKKKFN